MGRNFILNTKNILKSWVLMTENIIAFFSQKFKSWRYFVRHFLQRYFKIEGVHNSRLANLQSLHFCNAIEYPNYFSFMSVC